jgi:hypothetical protein
VKWKPIGPPAGAIDSAMVVIEIAAVAVAPELPSCAVTDPLVVPADAVNWHVKAPTPFVVIVEPDELPTVHAALGVWAPTSPGIVTVAVPP